MKTRAQYIAAIDRIKGAWLMAQRSPGREARTATLHARIVRLTKACFALPRDDD